MKIIDAYYEILDEIDSDKILKYIEKIGRVCYKSEERITDTSASKFVGMILRKGHESVLEHVKISVKFVCDRGVSHEIVRHRIASYSQESTRYCNYTNEKFGSELTYIRPFFWEENTREYELWLDCMAKIEETYNTMISLGATPEQARSILPNSLKTEICATMNLRQWRHFFRLRCAPGAHPQMRELAKPLLVELKTLLPVIFKDIQ